MIISVYNEIDLSVITEKVLLEIFIYVTIADLYKYARRVKLYNFSVVIFP